MRSEPQVANRLETLVHEAEAFLEHQTDPERACDLVPLTGDEFDIYMLYCSDPDYQVPIVVPLVRYQDWYTQASLMVQQLLPDRYEEFTEQYKVPGRAEVDRRTYSISDYFDGVRLGAGSKQEAEEGSHAAYLRRLQTQIAILRSAESRLKMRTVIELFERELSESEAKILRDILLRIDGGAQPTERERSWLRRLASAAPATLGNALLQLLSGLGVVLLSKRF